MKTTAKTTTIELKYPVTVDGTEISQLTMRNPKVSDMLAGEKGGGSDVKKEIRTFAHLCEISPETIEELYGADYLALQKAYKNFLSPKPKTSGAES